MMPAMPTDKSPSLLDSPNRQPIKICDYKIIEVNYSFKRMNFSDFIKVQCSEKWVWTLVDI